MKKNIKFTSLAMSMVAIVVLFTMLIGSTFAWFTDSVSSNGNIIKSGKLDVEMLWADGKEDPTNANWADASQGAIFNYDNWEPGYTEVRHIKIANAGTLALKYKVDIVANGEVSSLADVIDVYYADPAVQVVNRTDLTDANKIGSLTQVLGTIGLTASGNLVAGEDHTITLALKMRESAGNEYQNLSIGSDFSIKLVATQLSVESDGFGNDYDQDATLEFVCVENANELEVALANKEKNIFLTKNIVVDEMFEVQAQANINGNGYSLVRTNPLSRSVEEVYVGGVFNVAANTTLKLENIVVDGGAIWGGEVNPTLCRGTVNTSGIVATGALVGLNEKSKVILGDGAVLQNNDGANAVNLNTRVGAELIVDGGEIINNYSAGGAIWGGGKITLNSGKISYNHGTYGGAVRVVTNSNVDGVFMEINGGEMNNNYSDVGGGAIYAFAGTSYNLYLFNGGEMAYNSSPAGGAIYSGSYETIKIGGTFKMHDNKADTIGAIRLRDHASLVMTGGEIYDNGDNSLFLYNNSTSLIGGIIRDTFAYSGGLGLTMGNAQVKEIYYDLDTGHKRAYLAQEFSTFEFKVNQAHVGNFNFVPAAEYTYVEGDELKLVCLNEGYETYWDSETNTFRLRDIIQNNLA